MRDYPTYYQNKYPTIFAAFERTQTMMFVHLDHMIKQALRARDPKRLPKKLKGVIENILSKANYPENTDWQTALYQLTINAAPTHAEWNVVLTPPKKNNPLEVMLAILLFTSVDLNQYTEFTPLHMAAFQGDCDKIELLLTAGADINALRNDEVALGNCELLTPLELAFHQQQEEAVKLLIQHGAQLGPANYYVLRQLTQLPGEQKAMDAVTESIPRHRFGSS